MTYRYGTTELDSIFVTREEFLEALGPQLWSWGNNPSGELGDNTIVAKSSPVQTVAGGNVWMYGECGGDTAAGIKTDGTLWMWGLNDNGQLGINTIVNKSSPVQTIVGGDTWKSVAVGYRTTAAIKTDGTLWLWGLNTNGTIGDNTTVSKSSPVQTVAAGTNWERVSVGVSFAGAIKTDGSLWLWGNNSNGQLGNGLDTSQSSPIQTVMGGNNWKRVSCGPNHTLALTDSGEIWTWGLNSNGQLGNGAVESMSSPIQTIAGGTNWQSVSAGSACSAAIKTDGSLWLWGIGTSGQLGDNTAASKSSPVQTVSGGTNWMSVACGDFFTAAIKTDGTLWMWGLASQGQLGDNTITTKSSPVQTIAGGNTWQSVSCRPAAPFVVAIKA